jgi:uridine phosphorylase
MPFPSVTSKYLSTEIISAEAVIRDWEDSGLFDRASWSAESAILVYDRRLHAQLLETFDPEEVGFENVRFGGPGSYHALPDTDGRVILVGNFGIGAPVAAVVAETLIACGVREIISLGTAGGLQGDLSPGEIISVHGAVRDDGTSQHYLKPDVPVAPHDALTGRLETALGNALSTQGSVWTTDAPFRETIIELETHRDAGILAVEMEAAALMAVCEVRGAAFATSVCISDILSEEGWKALFSETEVREALMTMFKAAVTTLVKTK